MRFPPRAAALVVLVTLPLALAAAARAQNVMQQLRDALVQPPPLPPNGEQVEGPATPLTPGVATQGTSGANNQKTYALRTDGAGLLTVLVSCPQGDTDLWVQVMSEGGLPGGNEQRADNDPGGMMGLEYLAVPIADAGVQRITVGSNGERANFTIVTNWMPLPWLAKALPKAPDVNAAVDLRLNTPLTRAVPPAQQGEFQEWFVLSAPAGAGHMVVLVKADPGDTALEVFEANQLFQPILHIDNDPRGQMGNESLVTRMNGGERLYLRTTARGAEKYTIEARYLSDAPQPF